MIKDYDCVEMKHRGAEIVQLEIASLSIEEEVKYWAERTEAFRRLQAKMREESRKARDDINP